ncbi:MAG: glycoside hydrolase family 97 N-terminal domain-containing protein [Marinoscillum sp.]
MRKLLSLPRKMITNYGWVVVTCLVLLGCAGNSNTSIEVASPDGKNVFVLSFENGKGLSFEAKRLEEDETLRIIQPSTIQWVSGDLDFKGPFKISDVFSTSHKGEWQTRFGELSTVPDKYNETKVSLEGAEAKLNLIIRAYDEGLAFSYEIPEQKGLKEIGLDDERISYVFDRDYHVWSTPERKPGKLTAQGAYQRIPLSQLKSGAERPLLIEYSDDLKIALAEARLVDYARLSYDADPNTPYSIFSSLDGKLLKARQTPSPEL